MILTTKVIPTIGEQIEQAGQELPWITQQLMNFSDVLTSWRVLILIGGDRPDRHGVPAVLQDRARGLPAGPVPAVPAGLRAADQAAGRRPVRLDALDADRLGPVDGRIAARGRRDDGQHAHETGDSAGAGADSGRGRHRHARCGTAA